MRRNHYAMITLLISRNMNSTWQRHTDTVTEHSEPASHGAVHLIEDEDDDQVDDGCGRFDRQLHVAPCDGVGAHMESGLGGDPVDDHTKHNGKCNTYLFTET